MNERENRLRAAAPLWSDWQVGACLYTGEHTCVCLLERTRCGKRLTSVVKLIEIADADEHTRRARFAAAIDELERMELLAPSGYTVAALDDAVLERPDGIDVLIRMERLTCLADLLRDGEVFPPDEVRRVGRDICRALSFAHARGFVHRDVKPANIYRADSGRYLLGDFGVTARENAPSTDYAGTTAYMAPETACGRACDAKSDLYSLGVVLYQLLNGNFLPGTTENSTYSEREDALTRRQHGETPAPPTQGDPALQRAVLRALQPAPDDRFASTDDFAAALTPTPATEAPPKRRRPRWAIPVCLCACALCFAAGFGADRLTGGALPDNFIPAFAEAGANEQYDADNRFEVFPLAMTWENAKVYCEERGGHLATITSRQEETRVLDLLDEQGMKAAWIGANNRNSSRGFSWITGERFAYAAWAPNEPNNAGGNEYYLMLQKRGDVWTWNDSRDDGLTVVGGDAVGFVCEWDEPDA